MGLHLGADGEPAFYYDPYGLAPPREVRRFVRRAGKRLVWNRHKHQHSSSQHCGRYVIQWLKAMASARGGRQAAFTRFTTETFVPGEEERNRAKIERLSRH
jgi:hypothetical protein